MKIILELGTMTLWSILPTPAIIWDPERKTLEMGIYFLKYSITINIKK